MEGLFVYGLGHVIVKIALIIQSNCRTQYLLAVSLNVASWQVDVAFCFLELAITGPSLTYPAFASNWNIGFALTARHFCQTATKVPKKALPQRTALAPALLRGHAVTGHPWPNTALPASMPVDPLRRTSSRPPEGRVDQKPLQKQDQLPAEAAYRPTFLAKLISLNSPAGNRVSTAFRW